MRDLRDLEIKIGIKFNSKDLLTNVFVHDSYLNEHRRFYLPSNEKIEFLGDSVLSLITSVYLYKNYPQLVEGDYTEIKASIVRTESLAEAGLELELGKYLLLSKGQDIEDGRININMLADCFEALIGAIFLDRGFDAAYSFVLKYLFQNKLESIITNKTYMAGKSKLQEYTQAKYKITPKYSVLQETGPEHNRIFRVAVILKNKKLSEATGKSKKEAEEKAAKIALSFLK